MRKLVEITSYFQIIRGSVMRYTNYSCFKRDNSFFGGVVCTYRRKKSSEHYIVFIDHFVWMSDISFFLHKFNEEKKWPCTDNNQPKAWYLGEGVVTLTERIILLSEWMISVFICYTIVEQKDGCYIIIT